MKLDHSIVICSYNRCFSLKATLAALRAVKSIEVAIGEIIVVDNNSTDNTRAVIDEAMQQATIPLRYVFETKQGLSHARNRGIKEAKGAIIIFTDDDVIPDPDWLQQIINCFEAGKADCVGGKVLPAWPRNVPEWAHDTRLQKTLWGILALLDLGDETIVLNDINSSLLYGANMAFRRQIFDELGFFRTDLGLVGNKRFLGDDSEMLIRLIQAGKRVIYTPKAVVLHTVPEERLHLRYLRQWRFRKALTTNYDVGAKRTLPSTWLLRECAQNGLMTLLNYCLGKKVEGVRHDLQFWLQLGRIAGQLQLVKA